MGGGELAETAAAAWGDRGVALARNANRAKAGERTIHGIAEWEQEEDGIQV